MTQDASDVDSGDRGGRMRLYLALAFVGAVLVGMYVAAALYFGDRVPGNTTVGGVSVGGMTQAEARTALREGLADEAAEPIVVTVADEEVEIVPEDAGLALDHEASLEGLTGFSLNPVNLWNHATGGVTRPVETQVDEDRLAEAVDAATQDLDKKPKNATVSLEGASVKTTKAASGRTVEREDLTAAISEGWPQTRAYEAGTTEVEPGLTDEAVTAYVTDEVEPLLDGPVTVRTDNPKGDGAISVEVAPERLATAVSVAAKDEKLSVTVDEEKAAEAALAAAAASGEFREAKDAVVTRAGSGFEVSESQTGLALSRDGLGAKVAAAMSATGDARTITVDSTVTEPELTTEEAKASLPKETISTFTTYLPENPVRTANIRLAANTLNGTYVAPGETFSLNQTLGERTAAKGYQQAGVIYNGRLAEDYGGGISQLSTTLFNAVFFSGARIEEFHPHSFYISRYPEGREATIDWPSLDNRFTNDTGAGILISAGVTGNEVTVSFSGRKKYDEIRAGKSARRNIVQPKEIKDDSKDCVPQSPNQGFTVDITRTFIKGGRTVNSSSFTTRYDAADHIICTAD